MSQEVEIEWTGSGATSGVYDGFCTCCECQFPLGPRQAENESGFWIELVSGTTGFRVVLDLGSTIYPETITWSGGWINMGTSATGVETLEFDSYPVLDGIVFMRFASAEFVQAEGSPGIPADVRTNPPDTVCLDQWNPAITGLVTGMV